MYDTMLIFSYIPLYYYQQTSKRFVGKPSKMMMAKLILEAEKCVIETPPVIGVVWLGTIGTRNHCMLAIDDPEPIITHMKSYADDNIPKYMEAVIVVIGDRYIVNIVPNLHQCVSRCRFNALMNDVHVGLESKINVLCGSFGSGLIKSQSKELLDMIDTIGDTIDISFITTEQAKEISAHAVPGGEIETGDYDYYTLRATVIKADPNDPMDARLYTSGLYGITIDSNEPFDWSKLKNSLRTKL